jgi:hypothetical protein
MINETNREEFTADVLDWIENMVPDNEHKEL